MRKILATLVLIFVCLSFVSFSQVSDSLSLVKKQLLMKRIENETFSVINFMHYLELIEIKFPDIVVRQSIEETGWWTSTAFKKKHNLFGISKKGKCIRFGHWTQSVKVYKILQTKNLQKVKGKTKCYYSFLVAKRYSQNKRYVKNLRSIDLTRLKKYLLTQRDTMT